MIPILYEKDETQFTTNGLGRLTDCTYCRAIEERNGIYEAEFDYPVTGAHFDDIQIGRIIACTHDEQGDVQPFDIYAKSEPINGVVTFRAHHISYRLNEITVKPFTAGSCAEALSKIDSKSVTTNPFTFWTNKSVTATFMSETPRKARAMLGGENNSILDVYGTGEYEFDKFDVKLYLHRGQDTNVSIRYGKNLVDFNNDEDTSDVYTAIVPYWLGNETVGEESVTVLVTLPEWFLTSGHTVPSGREVIVPMDLSGEFSEKPSVSDLRTRAQSRLASSDGWLPNQTVTINFVQLWQTEEYKDYAPLQRLRLCDTCGVFVPMYGMSLRAKVIKVVYNVLLDRYDSMELGDKPTTYAAVLEKSFDSKAAGLEQGFQAIKIDIETVEQVAAADATQKANAAEQAAISAASTDATQKANAAQSAAISAAATDATQKANAAQSAAEATASADATAKANAAEAAAKGYTDTEIASAKSTIESEYEQAIEDATELIRGGTGGYIVTTVNANGKPIELLITDNLNLNQAVNIWRWNLGGLAHSSNGYNGPFTDVAITQDGKINASMIMTGTLNANLIRAGVLSDVSGDNSWNLATGELSMEKGSINLGNGKFIATDAGVLTALGGGNIQDVTGNNYWNLTSGVFSTKNGYIGDFSIGSGNLTYQSSARYVVVSKNEITYASSYTDNSRRGATLGANRLSFKDRSNESSWSMSERAYILFARSGPYMEFNANGGMRFFINSTIRMTIEPNAPQVYVNGTIGTSGAKPRVIDTDNYNTKMLYCYEMPSPMFGDIGESILDEEGICYVDLDDIFTETIIEKIEYQVFLQKEGEGDCWVADKHPRYFVIQGTPNLKVAWELKARQINYETTRFGDFKSPLEEYVYTQDEYFDDDDYINEQEALLYG